MISAEQRQAVAAPVSPAKAWLRALELTAAIPQDRRRTLPAVVHQLAQQLGDAPALLSDRETLTYAELSQRIHQYARWAIDHNIAKGDVVCLMMTSRPEYAAIWLGLISVGVVVSLLNTNLVGSSLAHCIRIASPRFILASGEFVDAVADALPHIESSPEVWTHGSTDASYPRIDLDSELGPGTALSFDQSRAPDIDDLALLIYTSGTTGLPKAAKITHARAMQWGQWFAGLMDVNPGDRMYDCLPMYHSVGGVQVIGAMLASGGSLVVREKFSAREFWDDIVRWDCTLFEYIGELCRYLLQTEPSVNERRHHIRLACGNGLAAEIWDAFQERFRIPQILEFYASTEGNVSLFNLRGVRGAIGHIPAYLTHRFAPLLIVTDAETGEPVRKSDGFCTVCGPNQTGEALGSLASDSPSPGARFDGYTSHEATEQKIVRNVLTAGDKYFRTGDQMRRNEKGYYFFVDRIGDTFRRKGENVATSEVAEVIAQFPGVLHANVYGVAVPGVEGRVGMAALVAKPGLDLQALDAHLARSLPIYARPVFLRLRNRADLTGTFKYSKVDLLREGYDPEKIRDPLYFKAEDGYVPLTAALHQRIQDGEFRL